MFVRTTLCAAAFMLSVCVAASDETSICDSDRVELEKYEDVIERLRAAIRHEVEAKDLPAFSIALVNGNDMIWAEGFGFQDAGQNRPATAATVYRVGSVSKLFTDIVVMRLVEREKLDLDAPIKQYLPNFAPRNESGIPITLHQLMSHRSGLVRESPVGNYFDPEEPSLQETVASLNNTSLVYKPEVKTKYSNAAVAVVGATLEERIGIPFSKQIEKSILNPLKMNSSSFCTHARCEAGVGDSIDVDL